MTEIAVIKRARIFHGTRVIKNHLMSQEDMKVAFIITKEAIKVCETLNQLTNRVLNNLSNKLGGKWFVQTWVDGFGTIISQNGLNLVCHVNYIIDELVFFIARTQ